MKNANSTSGIGEDVIRSFAQLGATEMHLKTLYEKTLAELENGIIDTEDAEAVKAHLEKLDSYRAELIGITQLRRQGMLILSKMYPDGDKDAWCLVKHLAIASECAFEAWQASDDDPMLMSYALDTNKAFTKAVTRFIGAEISDCSACLSDYLKAKGDNE